MNGDGADGDGKPPGPRANAMTVEYAAPHEKLHHPLLQRLFAYWTECCAGRFAPARADIDPVDFRYALGWVNLAEAVPGSEHFEFRVFGSSLSRVLDLGGEMASTRNTDDAEFDAIARGDMARVITEKKPLRIFRDIRTARRHYRFEVLLLPLSDDGETVNMLLICAIPPVGG